MHRALWHRGPEILGRQPMREQSEQSGLAGEPNRVIPVLLPHFPYMPGITQQWQQVRKFGDAEDGRSVIASSLRGGNQRLDAVGGFVEARVGQLIGGSTVSQVRDRVKRHGAKQRVIETVKCKPRERLFLWLRCQRKRCPLAPSRGRLPARAGPGGQQLHALFRSAVRCATSPLRVPANVGPSRACPENSRISPIDPSSAQWASTSQQNALSGQDAELVREQPDTVQHQGRGQGNLARSRRGGHDNRTVVGASFQHVAGRAGCTVDRNIKSHTPLEERQRAGQGERIKRLNAVDIELNLRTQPSSNAATALHPDVQVGKACRAAVVERTVHLPEDFGKTTQPRADPDDAGAVVDEQPLARQGAFDLWKRRSR